MSRSAPSASNAQIRLDVEDAVLREFRSAAGNHASDPVSLASDYRRDLGINSMGFTSAIGLLEKKLGVSLLEHLEQLSASTRLSDVAATITYAVKRARS
jgi:acyl carrier protein